ncbi:hypothetical protein EYF80_050799 [Liparis tanakae]|uniref:Uncharacterized protein n=1 Tax=Liparis tanakae TaxID=230148 RepID=A0A4Z2FDR7_9TELE|nr:hypothetical protein EYF80_050799 [Liparis tanakae]
MTPSSFGIKTAAFTASECPSILLSRIGLALCGLEWISAAMVSSRSPAARCSSRAVATKNKKKKKRRRRRRRRIS